jgi:hypothetical protein
MDIIQSSLGLVNLRIKVNPLYLPNIYYDHIEDFSCSTYIKVSPGHWSCVPAVSYATIRLESNLT